MSYDIKLFFESQSITIKKKGIFRTKTIVYNNLDLKGAEIYYKQEHRNKTQRHYYILYLVFNSGKKEEIHEYNSLELDRNPKGLKYLTDLINSHIQGEKKNYGNL